MTEKARIMITEIEYLLLRNENMYRVSIKFKYKSTVLAFSHECYSLIGFAIDYPLKI